MTANIRHSFQDIPESRPFVWVESAKEQPMHKVKVMGNTDEGVQRVYYNVRECGWFNEQNQRVRVITWMKTLRKLSDD